MQMRETMFSVRDLLYVAESTLLVVTIYLKKNILGCPPPTINYYYVLVKASGDAVFQIQKVADLGSMPVGNAAFCAIARCHLYSLLVKFP